MATVPTQMMVCGSEMSSLAKGGVAGFGVANCIKPLSCEPPFGGELSLQPGVCTYFRL